MCFEVIKKTRGQYEHRTHKREADQDKVFRTNRLKSNCAISKFFSRGYNENAQSKLISWEVLARSCFNSLTRRMFVSPDHGGRMSTQY